MGAGNSFQWYADKDSVTEPGMKCIMTDPIEGMTPEDFFQNFEQYVRERPLNPKLFEVKRELEPLADGGLHETANIEVSGIAAAIAGEIKMQMHSVYYFEAEKDQIRWDFFFHDSTLKEKATSTVLKALRSPFRIEGSIDEFSSRRAGPVLMTLAKSRLESLGYNVDVRADQPSILEPGKKSVVSGEISDQDLTLAKFWEMTSAKLEEEGSGTALPDGSVVVEQTAVGGLGQTTYQRYELSKEGDTMICMDFGPDEKMDELRVVQHWKVHSSPVRLEVWAQSLSGRRAGDPVKKMLEETVNNVLAFANKDQA